MPDGNETSPPGRVPTGWSAEMDRKAAEMVADPEGYYRRARHRFKGWRRNCRTCGTARAQHR